MLLLNARSFYLAISLILLFFSTVEAYCAFTNSVGLDEFHNIFLARKVLELVPYRDWQPFKTTLSMYFHSIPFHVFSEQWQVIHFLKLTNIILMASTLFFASLYLAKQYSRRAVVFGLFMLVCNSTFLSSVLEVRPDILNSITGLAGLLLILERRVFLAGIVVALSFCLSQKGIFYFLSTNSGLFFLCLIYRSRAYFIDLVKFNLFCFLGFFAYLVHASWQSTFSAVLANIFLKHLYLLKERNYPNVEIYWLQMIVENPLFIIILSLSVYFVVRNWKTLSNQNRYIFIYTLSLLICCLLFPEPFSYFYILLLPTLFIFNLLGIENYILPHFDVIKTKFLKIKNFSFVSAIISLSVTSLGIVYPIYFFCGTWQGGQAYQKVMTIIGNHLLQENETYFAGTSFLTFKEQSHPELVWLDMRKLLQLEQSSQAEQEKILQQFKENPPKFIYSNYKIDSLPQILVKYFEDNYFHYFGNIYIYSVAGGPGIKVLEVKYPGEYILLADFPIKFENSNLLISGETIKLNKGSYPNVDNNTFRLIFKPKLELDSRFDRYRDARD